MLDRRRSLHAAAALLAAVLAPPPTAWADEAPAADSRPAHVLPIEAPAPDGEPPRLERCCRPGADALSVYGDVRLRYEHDFDSVRANGVPRDDRRRMRTRVRLGFTYEPAPHWKVGARVRTGVTSSQQSPHLTFVDFDGGSTDAFDILLDKAFVQYTRCGLELWGGRNAFPYWKQNELLWDDDVTLTGLAASYTRPWLSGEVTGVAGGFFLPDGAHRLHGNLLGGQVAYERELRTWGFTLATGLFGILGDGPSTYLRNRNGDRDYLIWASNAQVRTKVGCVPVQVGVDAFWNLEDYSATDPDPFTAQHHDDRFGAVASVLLGRQKKRGDWQLGYFYADIEALAVNAAYAQDDWVRWGAAGQTDSSDLKGHEFRAAYKPCDALQIMARLYLVDAISSVQDGARFRLDLNLKL